MGFDATGRIYIDAAEVHDFLVEHLPEGLSEADFIKFGPLVKDEGGFHVEYAVSTECDPKDWVEPPNFMKPPPPEASHE